MAWFSRGTRKRFSEAAVTALMALGAAVPLPWSANCAAESVPHLDPTFGRDGIAGIPVAESATSLVVLANGEIVGSSGRTIARFDGNGVLLSACAIELPQGARAGGTLQRDGKLLAHVYVSQQVEASSLRRFHPDCSPDETFGAGGTVMGMYGQEIAVQPDGEVLLANGWYGPSFVPVSEFHGFSKEGNPTFALAGQYATGLTAVLLPWRDRRFYAVQNYSLSGSQFFSGYWFYVMRLTPDGVDRSFERWAVQDCNATDAVVGHDGSVYVAASCGPDIREILRFSPTGQRDLTFGIAGVLQTDWLVWKMAVEPGGWIVAALARDDGGTSLMRFSPQGSLDWGFGYLGQRDFATGFRQKPFAYSAEAKLMLAGIVDGNFAVSRMRMGPATVVGYYHAQLDHYFVTGNALEVADLDLGVHAGWARTGSSFRAWGSRDVASYDANPVCRFYIPPDRGNSHFYSASPAECASVSEMARTDPNYAGYLLETANAFYASLPDLATGECAPGRMPVYRLWNQRLDSNHFYTTDAAERQRMLARGYLPEGYGLDGTVMCALR